MKDSDPLSHFEHSLFLGNRMAKHDPSFWNTQRDRIEHVGGTVKCTIRFLQFSAYDNIDIRTLTAGVA